MNGFRFWAISFLAGSLLLSLFAGCLAPETLKATSPGMQEPTTRPDLDAYAEIEAEQENTLSWNDLTRLARDHMIQQEWDEAATKLEQAELQVRALAPGHVRRRTVFGIQARLAQTLAQRREFERADALTHQLIDQAEHSPQIAGPALISLAEATAERRLQEENTSKSRTEALRLRAVAMPIAERERASSSRLSLATQISESALHHGQLDLARRAADLAISDTLILSPSRTDRLSGLYIDRARIRQKQGDLKGAESDARRAETLLEGKDPSPPYLGIVWGRLAEILMEQGNANEALTQIERAEALLTSEPQTHPHIQRTILAARARLSRTLLETDRARQSYAEAIAIPEQGFEEDRYLLEQLLEESAAL